MLKNYITILKESLAKKQVILEKLIALSKEQAEVVSAENPDMDAFDKLVDDKDALVDEIIRLDGGFEETYKHIKEELPSRKEEFKEDIAYMQDMIRKITELSVSLEALEERNRKLITDCFNKEHAKISTSLRSTRAAADYYRAMSRVNYIDPQLMDRKK